MAPEANIPSSAPSPSPIPRSAKPSWTNGNKWATIRYAIQIVGAVAVVLGGAILFYLRGSLDVETVLALGLLGAGLVGLGGLGLPPSNRWPGAGGGVAALLILTALLSSGCATPCIAERISVAGVASAVDFADSQIPSDFAQRDTVLGWAHASLDLGRAATDACINIRDDAPWSAWVPVAAKILASVIAALDLAGVDVPDGIEELASAIGTVQ